MNHARTDILIVTALPSEFHALRMARRRIDGDWHEDAEKIEGCTVYRATLSHEREGHLTVRALRLARMGPTEAARLTGVAVDRLDPTAVAMSGICAGRRGEVDLGDVVFAGRTWPYDEGKFTVGADGPTWEGDPRVVGVHTDWLHRLDDILPHDKTYTPHFADPRRPPTRQAQARWLLGVIEGGDRRPNKHPDRLTCCPDYKTLVRELMHGKHVAMSRGALELTAEGQHWLVEQRILDPDADEPTLPRVVRGVMASGSAVVRDAGIFDRLRTHQRKTIALDMEAAAVAQAAGQRPFLIAKGVVDFADPRKGDNFHDFAARASAEWLLDALARMPFDAQRLNVVPARPSRVRPEPAPHVPGPMRAFRQLMRKIHGDLPDAFQATGTSRRVEDVFVELEVADTTGTYVSRPDRPLTLEHLLAAQATEVVGGDDVPSEPDDDPAETTWVWPRWIVLGPPGSGKSTIARRLTWLHAGHANPPTVLYVSLVDWLDHAHRTSEGDLFAYVQTALRRDGWDETHGIAGVLSDLAADELADNEQARLWVVLDGLDELDAHLVRQARRSIDAFARGHGRVAVAVMSREIGAISLGGGFRRARVRALDEVQQRRLLEKWLGPEVGADVFRSISRTGALSTLAGNPLMLALMARIIANRGDGRLPGTRVELLDEAIDMLLRRGHAVDAVSGVTAPTVARRVLRRLAVDLTARPGEAWPQETFVHALHEACRAVPDLDRDIEQVWGGVSGCLDVLARRTGLIGPQGEHRDRWHFLHRALREALASEAVAQEGEDAAVARLEEIAQDEAKLGRWGETLGLACARLDDPIRPLDRVRGVDDRLVVRLLSNLTGLPLTVLLGRLYRIDPRLDSPHRPPIWDGRDLLAIVRQWGPAEARQALLETAGRLDLDRLAFVHFALTSLGGEPIPGDFYPRPPARWDPNRFVSLGDTSFRMGRSEAVRGAGEAESPSHQVDLTRRYRLARQPVTLGEYRCFDPRHSGRGEDKPVVDLSWWRARLFAGWAGGRLPTEAEWENACRLGLGRAKPGELNQGIWHAANSRGELQPVARLPADAIGLFDMLGNVFEWCEDGVEAYAIGRRRDPVGQITDNRRILRGSSFVDRLEACRPTRRYAQRADRGLPYAGFRLAQDT